MPHTDLEPPSRAALRAARVLEISPFAVAAGLLLAFIIGVASASLTPHMAGIGGLGNPLIAMFGVATSIRLVVLLTVGVGSIVLVGAQARSGPGKSWAWATIAGAAASCALFVADALLILLRLPQFGIGIPASDIASWEIGIGWSIRAVGAVTLADLVLVLRARGGLPRWGLPLVVATLLSPVIHLLGVEILDGTASFLLICAVGTAWRLQFQGETEGAIIDPSVLSASR